MRYTREIKKEHLLYYKQKKKSSYDMMFDSHEGIVFTVQFICCLWQYGEYYTI